MKTARLPVLLLAPVLVLAGCVTTTTRSTTLGDGPGRDWERYGHVEKIRETVQRQEGNPAGGAVAGALIGGVLGSVIGGHTHYDRWGGAHTHASGAGAVLGAVGGAMIGAAASQGGSEDRWYEVRVRFEDGGAQTFVFHGALPFRVGEPVRLTGRGLEHAGDA